MKKIMTLGIFLVLILMSPAMSQAEDQRPRHARGDLMSPSSQAQSPGAEASSALSKVKTYDELRHAISEARAQSRLRVEKVVEQERVREAWEIGRLIDAHVLQHKERADYGKQVLLKLAKDLGMSDTELGYMLRFARAYPISPHAGKLSWSAYRDLLVVKVPEKRKALAEQAEKENWTRNRLREEIKNLKGGQTPFLEAKWSQTLKPGKPGTYRVIRAFAGPYKGQLALDLGFSNYYRPPGKFPFKDRQIVESARGKLKRSHRTEADLFTYEADVYRALDGDTLMAVVDLGFGFVTTQTLRLRGIDAPEIATRDGMEAKEFVEQKLRSTETKKQKKSLPLVSGLSASPVLIRTVKSDKYDRYLADVFVDGTYINQQLVEKGFALRVQS